jgi:hypothetical protein
MKTHRKKTDREPVENQLKPGDTGGKNDTQTQRYCFSILYFYCDRCTIIRLVSLDFCSPHIRIFQTFARCTFG